jgi:hypothetical protein
VVKSTSPLHLRTSLLIGTIGSIHIPLSLGGNIYIPLPGHHISCVRCYMPMAMPSKPYPSLIQAFHPQHSDRVIWLASYKEEYDGLKEFDTFEELTIAEYRKLAETHGPAIPSMCVLVSNKNEHGKPVHAKSRIVVLGNKYPHQWTTQQYDSSCLSPSNTTSLLNKVIVKTRSAIQSYLTVKSLLYAPLQDVHSPNQIHSGDSAKISMVYTDHPSTGMKCSGPSCKFADSSHVPTHHVSFTAIPSQASPPLYLAVYVDDFIYFQLMTPWNDTLRRQYKHNSG